MPGFAALIAKKGPTDFFNFPLRALSPLTITKKTASGYTVCHFITQKFERDKICQEDDELLVALEGALLNSRDLQARHATSDMFQTVKRMYAAGGDEFFRDFRGEFSGLLYDKSRDKWLAFTNQTGMKPVFYCRWDGGFACATDLLVLTRLLRAAGRPFSLDVDAAYMLLTYGYMLGDSTLFSEIRKLPAGHYLKYESSAVSAQSYHVFRNDVWLKSSLDEMIEEFEHLFREAVVQEYEKDREYGYRHFAHMSGGRDCRLSAFVANELGYKGCVNVTFSQSDTPDEALSKRMACDLGNEFVFYALDSARCLTTTVEDAVRISGGLVFYSGAAHELSCYRTLNFEPFGGIHSGQLGDAVLGSYRPALEPRKPKLSSGATSTRLMDRLRPVAERVIARFDTEEMFKFYNRGFNGIANGNWMGNQYTEMFSPFLHREFLEFTFKLPSVMKHRSLLYEQWILRKHPRAAAYPTARTTCRIGTSPLLTIWRDGYRHFRRKYLGEWRTYSMNPYNYWYATKPELREWFADYFDKQITLLQAYPQLQADCRTLFQEGSATEKCQTITLLEAIKQHCHPAAAEVAPLSTTP